jgi:hypothetical protein
MDSENTDNTRIKAAEIKFMRTAKYAWLDCKRKEDVLKELKADPVLDKILKCETIWIQHVDRIQRDFPN